MAKTRMHISSGRRYVNGIHTVYRSALAAIVEIDMHLKRADVDCIGTGTIDDYPFIWCIWFCNSDESFFKGKRITKAHGEIYFPEFTTQDGWRIHSACRTGRYTLGVTFVRQEDASVAIG